MITHFTEQYLGSDELTVKLKSVYFLSSVAALMFLLSATLFAQGWTPLTPTGDTPEARFGHSMVTLPDGRVVSFGGKGEYDTLFNDLNVFRDTWTEITPTGDIPEARSGHSMVTLPDGRVMLFGGENEAGDVLNDLHVFQDNGWVTEVPNNQPPPARTNHGATVLDDGRLVVVGGIGENQAYLNDLWLYDWTTKNWEQGASATRGFEGPAIGALHYDIYILGQLENGKLYHYDVNQNLWDEFVPNGPYPPNMRDYPVNTQYDDKVLFGGGKGWDPTVGGQVIHDDFWVFDLMSNTWTKLGHLPVPLYKSAAAAYEGQSIHMLVFGGITDGEVVIGDTYEYVTESLGVESFEGKPAEFSLSQNYPNPFNPSTTIQFNVAKSVHVKLDIHDLLGTEVLTLIDSEYQPGKYNVTFDANRLTTGIYFYRVIMGDYTAVKKMAILK